MRQKSEECNSLSRCSHGGVANNTQTHYGNIFSIIIEVYRKEWYLEPVLANQGLGMVQITLYFMISSFFLFAEKGHGLSIEFFKKQYKSNFFFFEKQDPEREKKTDPNNKKSQLHTWWVKTITLKEGSRHTKRMPINMTLKEGKLTWTEVNVDGNSIWVTKWSVKETLFKAYSSEVDVLPRTSHHASSFSCKNKNKLSLFTN